MPTIGILVFIGIVLVGVFVYKMLMKSKKFRKFIEDLTNPDIDEKTSSDILEANENVKKIAKEKIEQDKKAIEDTEKSKKALEDVFEDKDEDKPKNTTKPKGGKKTNKKSKTSKKDK